MGTTLENGVYLPSEGERNCYAGLKTNWEILDQKVADVTALQQAVAGALHREIVESLPTTDINPNTIYMILSGTSATENVYNEYMYVNNAWELIGTSATDLTNYYTKAEVDGKLLLKANASDLTSHTGDTTIHVTASDKNKWNNQTYVFRYSSTPLVASSTNSNTLLDNTDNLKVGDKVIDSDGVLFSITAIDTANSTFSIGTALVDLALDANVVHTSGHETVGGSKTFSEGMGLNSWLYFTNSLVTKGTIPQSTVNPYRIYFGSGVNYGASLFNIDTSVSNTGVQSFTFRSAENVVSGDDARFSLIYDPNRTQPRYLAVKGNIEPNTNNTYDCGLGTNIWKDLYCYHGYFRGQQQNDEYSGNARTNLTLLANRDTLGTSGCLIDSFRENTIQGTGSHIIGFGIRENSVRYEGCRFSWLWDDNLGGYRFAFRPTLQGTNQAVEHDIGLSTDKWDKINGVEPSALGMPDLSNGIDISSYITISQPGVEDVHTSTYTPTVNGFISVCLSRNGVCGVGIEQGDMRTYAREVPRTDLTTRYAFAYLPVVQNVQVNIISCYADGIVSAKFFPCLGNV